MPAMQVALISQLDPCKIEHRVSLGQFIGLQGHVHILLLNYNQIKECLEHI